MRKTLKSTPRDILEGPVLKTLLRLAIPTIIAFAFHTTFNFIDRLFVSRLGEVEFGALGMAFIVQSIILAIGSGIGIGAGSLVARFIGAGKYDKAGSAAEHTLLIILALAAVLTVLGPLLSRPLFILLGASEIMLPYILAYINIILYGSFFQIFSMIGNGILRGEGNTVTPMRVMLIGTLVNLGLDPLLIFGLGPIPALGVRGAALATVTGRAASSLVLAYALLGKKNIVKINMKRFRFNDRIIGGIFAVGGPTVISHFTMSLGLSLLFILIRPYGDLAKAAFTMGFTYQQVAVLPLLGIAQGTLTMAGQNFGARNFTRIKSIIYQSLLFSMTLMAVLTLVCITGRESFAKVFSRQGEVIAIGKIMLTIISLGFPFLAGRIILSSYFQGLGMGFKALFLNMAQIIIFTFPLALLLSALLGLEGIWIGMALGNLLCLVLGLFWAAATNRKIECRTVRA